MKDYERQFNEMPTYEQIAEGLGKDMKKMKIKIIEDDDKKFEIEENKKRGVKLKTKDEETVNIPLIGSVSCGMPMFAEANIEGYIPVQKNFFKNQFKKYFFLKAQGDSMNEAGIDDGDLLLIESRSTANPGDKVLALIGDEATVKFYKLGNGYAVLLPKSTNPDHKPIIVKDNLAVQGIVVEIIKGSDLRI